MHAVEQGAKTGLPPGGTPGQVLTQKTDGKAEWADPIATPETIVQAVDQGVAEQRFDFSALVETAISI